MTKRGFGYKGSKKEKEGMEIFFTFITVIFSLLWTLFLGIVNFASSVYKRYRERKTD